MIAFDQRILGQEAAIVAALKFFVRPDTAELDAEQVSHLHSSFSLTLSTMCTRNFVAPITFLIRLTNG